MGAVPAATRLPTAPLLARPFAPAAAPRYPWRLDARTAAKRAILARLAASGGGEQAAAAAAVAALDPAAAEPAAAAAAANAASNDSAADPPAAAVAAAEAAQPTGGTEPPPPPPPPFSAGADEKALLQDALDSDSDEEALSKLDQLQAAFPANPHFVLAAARLAARRRDDGAAAELFERALQRASAPRDASVVLAAAGAAEAAAGRRDQARTLLQRAVEADPRHAAAHSGLGRLAEADGDDEAAAAHYEAAIAVDPKHAPSLQALALLHARGGRLRSARAVFQRAVQACPGNAPLYQVRRRGGELGGTPRLSSALPAVACIRSCWPPQAWNRPTLAARPDPCPAPPPCPQAWALLEWRRLGSYPNAKRLLVEAELACPPHAPLLAAHAKCAGPGSLRSRFSRRAPALARCLPRCRAPTGRESRPRVPSAAAPAGWRRSGATSPRRASCGAARCRWTRPTPSPSSGWPSWRRAPATRRPRCGCTSRACARTRAPPTCTLRWHSCRRRRAAGLMAVRIPALRRQGAAPAAADWRAACSSQLSGPMTRSCLIVLAVLFLLRARRLLACPPACPSPTARAQVKDLEAARGTWLRVVALEPTNGHACHALGSREQQEGHFGAAEQWFRRGCDSAGARARSRAYQHRCAAHVLA